MIKKIVLFYELTVHSLPYLICTRLFSLRSILLCFNVGVRMELTFILF